MGSFEHRPGGRERSASEAAVGRVKAELAIDNTVEAGGLKKGQIEAHFCRKTADPEELLGTVIDHRMSELTDRCSSIGGRAVALQQFALQDGRLGEGGLGKRA